MSSTEQNQNEDMQMAKADTANLYSGASTLKLSETEMTKLAAPFPDEDYEIRPDGFIYVPQSVTLKRLNDVLGIGNWALQLINQGKDEVQPGTFKVFFDGALYIRGCFVSRAVGESTYHRTNANSSWASAFEAAKSDCRQRCCKDLGIANDAWNPSFMRRWKKQYGVRVFVKDNGKTSPVWRRNDVDPLWNETGLVPTTPTVPDNKNADKTTDEKPWLNHGPEYDAVLRDLLATESTLATIRTKYKVSKDTDKALITVLTDHWIRKTDECDDMTKLTGLYNDNNAFLDSHKFLVDVFTARRMILVKSKSKAA